MRPQREARNHPSRQTKPTTPYLAHVLEALQLIASEVEYDPLVATLVRVALAQTSADQIFVLNALASELVGEGERGGEVRVYPSGLALAARPMLQTRLLAAAQSSQHLMVESEAGVRMCAPLRTQNNLLGWLYVEWRQATRLPSRQGELLQIIATQAAIIWKTPNSMSDCARR